MLTMILPGPRVPVLTDDGHGAVEQHGWPGPVLP
jgi:hypothetical protein